MKSAAACTLTGFFFTCWVAAHSGKKDKSVVLNHQPLRENKQNTQVQFDTCAHLVMEECTSLSSCLALLEMLLCCNERQVFKFTEINSDGGQKLALQRF